MQVFRSSSLAACLLLCVCANPGDVAFQRGEYRLAAEQGHPEAQWLVGVAYAGGLGVERDAKAALRWFHAAAEAGHPAAQHELGLAYQEGVLVPRSMLEAARWFRASAEAGHPGAQFVYGALCLEGRWVTLGPRHGARWITRAAESGHPRGPGRARVPVPPRNRRRVQERREGQRVAGEGGRAG